MTTTSMSQDHLDELAAAFKFAAQPGSHSVELTMIGSPEGDSVCAFFTADGTVTATAQAMPNADVVLTLPWKDTVRIASGELLPPVAYMQGLLKASGNMTLFLAILKG